MHQGLFSDELKPAEVTLVFKRGFKYNKKLSTSQYFGHIINIM